jgi:hypothetical protein
MFPLIKLFFGKNLTICFLPFERVQFPYTLCAQLLSFFIEFQQWCFFPFLQHMGLTLIPALKDLSDGKHVLSCLFNLGIK